MPHTAKNKTLGRKAAARKALLIGQSNALLQQRRIVTTIIKAKTLARFIAPIITGARNRSVKDVNHAYRQAFSKLRNKKSVQTLFNQVLPQIKNRQGGYTRVIKLSKYQKGDGASRALIELVDFNPLLSKTKKTKTRRGRRKKDPQTQPEQTTPKTIEKSQSTSQKQEKKQKNQLPIT